jgi:hypothetical protein
MDVQARQAYIHILEAELVDAHAKIYRVADWYEDMQQLLKEKKYGELCTLMDVGIREGYLRYISERQFTRLLANMFISSDARSPMYHLTKARLREGYKLTKEDCALVRDRISRDKLIADMIHTPPPGDANMYELCTIVGLPNGLYQNGCIHNLKEMQICDACFNALCALDYSKLRTHTFVAIWFYVPDAYLDDMRAHSNIPEHVIHDWKIKNARFRENNLCVFVRASYNIPRQYYIQFFCVKN